jgi:hypothetical protein
MKPTKEEIKKRIVADTRAYEICAKGPQPEIFKEMFPEFIGEDGVIRVPIIKGDHDGMRYFEILMTDPDLQHEFWENSYPYIGYDWGEPPPVPSYKDSNIPESMPIHLKKNLLAILVCLGPTDCIVIIPRTALINRPDLQELFREYIRNNGIAYIPFYEDKPKNSGQKRMPFERYALLKNIIKGEYPEYEGHYCYMDQFKHLQMKK